MGQDFAKRAETSGAERVDAELAQFKFRLRHDAFAGAEAEHVEGFAGAVAEGFDSIPSADAFHFFPDIGLVTRFTDDGTDRVENRPFREKDLAPWERHVAEAVAGEIVIPADGSDPNDAAGPEPAMHIGEHSGGISEVFKRIKEDGTVCRMRGDFGRKSKSNLIGTIWKPRGKNATTRLNFLKIDVDIDDMLCSALKPVQRAAAQAAADVNEASTKRKFLHKTGSLSGAGVDLSIKIVCLIEVARMSRLLARDIAREPGDGTAEGVR